MPMYLRPRVTGARVFFTVALQARGSDLLVREVEALRTAVRATRAERPFGIDVWVVLPDRVHAVWAMPAGGRDHGVRRGAIKARFSMSLRSAGFTPPIPTVVNGGVNPALRNGQVAIWQKRFWEHHIRGEADWHAHVRYCWVNPVKHGRCVRVGILRVC
jgi:putative transposase